MNDETLFDQSKVNEEPKNAEQLNDETLIENTNSVGQEKEVPPSSKEKKKNKWGIAAAAGAAGVGLGTAMPLIPKLVFPNITEEGDMADEGGELEEVESPSISNHLIGHDMDVAIGVDDSMSFNEAFAAARREVGPGGLFRWHGGTYGTYYGNEWNAMTPEDREQYWTDVYHTTSNLNKTAHETVDSDPVPEPYPFPDQDSFVDNREHDNQNAQDNDNDTPSEPQQPTPPDGDSSLGNEVEPLVLDQQDVISTIDLDGDGSVDVVVVDANGNEIEDLVLDTTGDGQLDTLVLDPVIVINDEDVVAIDGLAVTTNDPSIVGNGDENMSNFDEANQMEALDESFESDDLDPVEEACTENPDLDDYASIVSDPDVTIDNNMDMDDFVG